MKKWVPVILIAMFSVVYSCSHQGDRSISSVNDENPEIPEDYRISCVNHGGEVQEGDCRCLKTGKFIDPYQENCE